MDATKQRVKAATAGKKEEAKKAKGQEGTSSSVPTAVSKGSAKRKVDGEDDHPSKTVAVSPWDAHPKKSPPKPGRGTSKGMMTSTGPVIEGPHRLLTHKDADPCVELGTEELGASTLFDLTWVNLFPWLISSPFFFSFFF